jgi:phosphoenolpyruvate carboxylase
MGIPPALIGLGRGIREASRKLGEAEIEDIVKKLLPLLPLDIEFDLQYASLDMLRSYTGDEKLLTMLREDIEYAKTFIRSDPEPSSEYIETLLRAREAIKRGLRKEAE